MLSNNEHVLNLKDYSPKHYISNNYTSHIAYVKQFL